ncbi:MAG: hypothetical protein V1823_03760 [Chloroflexota bacterium]
MLAGIIGKIGRTSALVILAVMVALGVLLAVVEYTDAGVISEVSSEQFTLSGYDLSQVPDSVRQDAQNLAGGMFSRHSEERGNFIQQLLVTYLEARDKDFILFYNPGGWGYSLLKDSSGWQSIVAGIEVKLNSQGYELLPLSYRRTQDSWLGSLDEISEMAVQYNQKARTLAVRLDFLTSHNPGVRVILASESNGIIISDRVMALLKDNDRVYGIQTGSPFWYHTENRERTLIMNDNGEIPDSFSQGDFLTMMTANFKTWFGFSRPEEGRGTILKVFRAPGHYYSWQQAKVSREVSSFLDQILAGSDEPAGVRPG